MSFEQNKINEGLAGDAYKIYSLAKMAKGRVSAAVAKKKMQDAAKKEEEENKEVEEENFKMNTKTRSLNKFDTAYEGTMSKLYEPLSEEEKEKGFLGKAWDTAKTVAGAAALVGGGYALGNPALRGKIGDALKGAWKGGKTGAKGLAARRLTDAGAGAAQQATLTTPGAQAAHTADVENVYGIPQEPAGAAPPTPPAASVPQAVPPGASADPAAVDTVTQDALANRPYGTTQPATAPATRIGPAMARSLPDTAAAKAFAKSYEDAIKLNTPSATRHGTGPARPTGTPSPGAGVSPTPPTGKPEFSDRRIGSQGKTPPPRTPKELKDYNDRIKKLEKARQEFDRKMPPLKLPK